MGYAIFTARKLMLTNRINQLNFRILQLSQQQQTLSEQAARAEMAMSNIKNMYSNIGSMLTMGLQVGQQAKQNSMSQILMNEGITSADTTGVYAERMRQELAPFIAKQQLVTSVFGMYQQSIETQNQAQLKQIKEMENNIELQRKSLETQAKDAEAELKKVEEAEDKHIESSAPKFA